jgi:3-isopropylmalate/(R)-2-methylmalate dehydratase small subunit
LPIKLAENQVQELLKAAEDSLNFEIDLEKQRISYIANNEAKEVEFDIDSAKKACLIERIDDIGLTLNKVSHISEFEDKQKSMNPWLYSQKLK